MTENRRVSPPTYGFYESLIQILPPRTVSDRTCFRRLASWLGREVAEGRRDETAMREVLIYAREATLPGSRNPHAVFMSILRKELGYDPKR